MKIDKLNLVNLRNDEHFQLNTEFRDAILKFGAAALKIETQFEPFQTLYVQEDEALKKITKSVITAEIQEADRRRDQLFRGIIDANKSALNHFSEDKQNAAKRLKVLFDTYGNVAQKPLNEQTSAVYNLLQDLINGTYAGDIERLGIGDWVVELQAANSRFDTLMKERYEETAMRTDLKLRQVRLQIDAAYRVITERIDALVVVEGAANYEEFIRYWNAVVAKYSAILAKRMGKKTING